MNKHNTYKSGIHKILNKFEHDFAYILWDYYQEKVDLPDYTIVELFNRYEYQEFTPEDHIAFKKWLQALRKRANGAIYKLSFTDEGKKIKKIKL